MGEGGGEESEKRYGGASVEIHLAKQTTRFGPVNPSIPGVPTFVALFPLPPPVGRRVSQEIHRSCKIISARSLETPEPVVRDGRDRGRRTYLLPLFRCQAQRDDSIIIVGKKINRSRIPKRTDDIWIYFRNIISKNFSK